MKIQPGAPAYQASASTVIQGNSSDVWEAPPSTCAKGTANARNPRLSMRLFPAENIPLLRSELLFPRGKLPQEPPVSDLVRKLIRGRKGGPSHSGVSVQNH